MQPVIGSVAGEGGSLVAVAAMKLFETLHGFVLNRNPAR
jgi:hypothetical protein